MDYSTLKRIEKFNLKGRKLLIPNMHPFGSHLLAASLCAFSVNAIVMDTYKGLQKGKEYTSSKECFPCQVTLGDVIYFLEGEKNRLKNRFNPEDYIYFMPESDGPCRFGMYNKLHTIVLDSIPYYRGVGITYLSTGDSYDTTGILSPEDASKFRKLAYVTTVIADVLDKICFRVRPYEIKKGETDKTVKKGLWDITRLIRERETKLPFNDMCELLSKIAKKASQLIDPFSKRKPQIGIVGEIYLRSHPPSNQFIIKRIEELGGEVTNATLGEWLNFITYENIRKSKIKIKKCIREREYLSLWNEMKFFISKTIEQKYQKLRQRQVYDAVLKYLDIHEDHDIFELQQKLNNNSIYSFEVGTEACLSIAGAINYIEENFHGIVNVYPFGCMPSTITSAILKPLLKKIHVPYIDAPYDGTIQPNGDIILKTFMYQASLRNL